MISRKGGSGTAQAPDEGHRRSTTLSGNEARRRHDVAAALSVIHQPSELTIASPGPRLPACYRFGDQAHVCGRALLAANDTESNQSARGRRSPMTRTTWGPVRYSATALRMILAALAPRSSRFRAARAHGAASCQAAGGVMTTVSISFVMSFSIAVVRIFAARLRRSELTALSRQ